MPIGPDMLMPELHSELAQVGAKLLVDCVNRIPISLIEAKPQDDAVVSYGIYSKKLSHQTILKLVTFF